MEINQLSLRQIFKLKSIFQIFNCLVLVSLALVQVIRYKSATQVDFEVSGLAHQQKALASKSTFLLEQALRAQVPEEKEKLMRDLAATNISFEKNHKILTGSEPFLDGRVYEVPSDMQKAFYGDNGVHTFSIELIAKIKALIASKASAADIDWLTSKEVSASPLHFESLINQLESSSEARQSRFLILTGFFCFVLAGFAVSINLLLARWAFRNASSRIHELEQKCRNLEIGTSSVSDREGLVQIGQITGGLIHELKNPLAVVTNMAEFSLFKLKSGPLETEKVQETLSSILKMSLRINETLNAFRAMTQSVSRNPLESVKVKKIFDDSAAMTKDEVLNKEIQIEFIAPPSDLAASCRPADIHQVIKILIQNSVEALANRASGAWIRVEAADVGGQVQFSVTDSGEGIPVSHKDHIFKPFFTTKGAAASSPHNPTAGGFGLGLNLAERVLKSQNGKIWLDENHSNTRFVFSVAKADAKSLTAGDRTATNLKAVA